MNISRLLEEKVLPFVKSPASYCNNELNSIHKNFDETDVKVAFCYPDLYEVGMANLGVNIFYDIINSLDYALLERVFLPATDCEEIMRKEGIPLFSLESRRDVKEFDILGFTLQTELLYSNVLFSLDLAGIPFRSEDRNDSYPLIIGGGVNSFNPEPMADYFDLIVVGEGEDVFSEIVELYRKMRRDGCSRPEILEGLSKIKGVYVPSFYDVTYNADDTVAAIETKSEEFPKVIEKRFVSDLNNVSYPLKPLVPFSSVVHDRCVVEIMRGCLRGCRFCHAGFTTRPTREKSAQKVIETAKEIIDNTGYEEVSLISLSSSDHSGIDQCATELGEEFKDKHISMSLPSLRADTVSESLTSQLSQVRKAGFTIAPEAGSQRMRDIINKNLSEEQILMAARNVFLSGVQSLKLYFMIGLPFEQDSDVEAIGALAKKIIEVSKSIPEHRLKRIVVNVSFLVPKSHTPFQWVPMISKDEIFRKVALIKQSIKKDRKITFKYHEIDTSVLEGILSRGDRRLSKAIEIAYLSGCKMDSWRESFNMDKWLAAFADCGIDVEFFLSRERGDEEVFPWDHISCGVKKEYLLSEYKKAKEQKLTPICFEGCKRCGVC